MLKILHVTAYPPNKTGGLMIYIKNLVEHETKHGVYCEILTTNLERRKNYYQIINGIKVNFIKSIGDVWGINPLFNIIPFFRLNAKKFDIIHVHSYIHFSSIQAVVMAKILQIPVILTLHGGVQTSYWGASSISDVVQLFFKRSIFDKIIGRLMITLPDGLISVSKPDLLAINSIFSISREKNSFWIPNAVSLDFSKKNENKKIKRKFITYVSPRLTRIKGFDLFLKIMSEVNKKWPSIPILIVGDGELRSLIKNYDKELNITYIPHVQNAKMADIYYQSKIYVLSSRFEGLPTTLLEAMACCTPVVSTNVGGIPDLLQDNYNSFLYEPLDIKQAATKINMLIRSEETQKKFAQRSKKIIEKNFSWNIVTKKNIKVYFKLKKF
ncbi:glycosyltransferase family 4 protein [Candidatus Lokiarchaeum ossiferum]|uniref:glycosyltransferase family 4 protein n=1 Tax=Candidatus Lokiarchaeum ossiferum TaxID=2951803 RepID=UPI00352C9930